MEEDKNLSQDNGVQNTREEHEHPAGVFFKDPIYYDVTIRIPARYAEGLSQTQFFSLPDKEKAVRMLILHLLNAMMSQYGVSLGEKKQQA